jgi:hypothetical protein
MVEEIIRDRDLDPNAIFRVRLGGYLAFDERDWVKDIEFKVFDVPVTELPQYRAYAGLLQQVNETIWSLKSSMSRFNMLAMRLLNVGGHRRFKNIDEVDATVKEQLLVHDRLQELKSQLTGCLNRYVQERTVTGQYTRYLQSLDTFLRGFQEQFERLKSDVESLNRRITLLCMDQKVTEGEDQQTATAQVSGQRQIVDPFASGQLKLDE